MPRLPIFSIIFASVLFISISTICTSLFLLNKPMKATSGHASDITSTASHESQKQKSIAVIEKRILQSLVSFGLALTTFTSTSQAIDLPASYTSDDKSITFKYSEDLVFSPKPLKTHDKEILFKSETIKGFNAGVSVDRVKINNIREFADAQGLAQKVVDVEMTKDGVLESIALKWGESKTPISVSNLPAYEIEYKVDSTRGKNHYLIKTSVVNKKLYVFTVQCKEESYPELADTAHSIIDSFRIEEGLTMAY